MRSNILMLALVTLTMTLTGAIYCPVIDDQENKEMDFTYEPSVVAVGCRGTYTEMHCCIKGVFRIQWFQRKGNQWVDFLEIYPKSKRKVDRETRNQTILFTEASTEFDEGEFKCVGYGKRHTPIENIFRMQIKNCTNPVPPDILLPNNNTVKSAVIGSNLVIKCKAYFGFMNVTCNNRLDRCIVVWFTCKADDICVTVPNNTSARVFSTEAVKTDAGISLETYLNITAVTEEDYTTRYACTAKNSIEALRYDVYIEQAKDSSICVACIVVPVAVFLVGGFIAYHCLHLKVRLYFKLRKGPPPPGDAIDHEVAVVYNIESEKCQDFFEQILLPRLKKKYGNVYVPEVACMGYEAMTNAYAKVERSRVVLFVLCDSFFNNPLCTYCLDTMVPSQRGIVFIVHDKLDNNMLNKQMDSTRLAIKRGRQVTIKNVDLNSRKKWKIDRFWTELQLQMPNPACPKQNDLKNGLCVRSSDLPLLNYSNTFTTSSVDNSLVRSNSISDDAGWQIQRQETLSGDSGMYSL